MLHRSDQVKQMGPFGVRQRLGAGGVRASLWDGGQDQCGRADRRKPLRVTVDVGELRSPGLVVMENRVHLAGHDLQAIAPQQGPGLVTPVRPESWRARRARTLPDRSRVTTT